MKSRCILVLSCVMLWLGTPARAGTPAYVLEAAGVCGAIRRDFRTQLQGVPMYPDAAERGVLIWDSELYWLLPDDFPAGTYTIALRHGGASPNAPGDYAFYVNDRLGFFGSSTVPRYLGAPVGSPAWGAQCWLADQYSDDTWALKPGDMIRLLGGHARIVEALHFHRDPIAGPIPLVVPPVPFKMYQWKADIERWQVAMETALPADPGGVATVTYTVRNVSGRPLQLTARDWVVDYFQDPIGEPHTQILALQNLETAEIVVRVPTGATPHYQARLRLTDADDFHEIFTRDIRSDVNVGDRRRQRLDEDWEWQWQPGIQLAEQPSRDGEWEATEVPPKRWTLNAWREKYCGWYRRTFTAPEIPAGTRVFLHFERVDYECRVFLNGAEVGGNHGGYFPFDIEITEQLQAGENRLEVGVRNWIAVLAPEFFERPDAEALLRETFTGWVGLRADIFDYRINVVAFANNQEHLAHWRGQGGIEHAVWLETRPRIAIDDVFVKPSVRNETVAADVGIVNAQDTAVRLEVRNRILREGRPLRELPVQRVTVPAGGEARVAAVTGAQGLAFWDVGDPVLHTLETVITDPEAPERTLDRRRTRFGYRELWEDGPHFVLNHRPIKLRSAWGAGGERSTWDSVRDRMPLHLARGETGFRTHLAPGVPSLVYDIADEMGMIGKPELCVNQGDAWKNPRFWENYLEQLRHMVRRDRNRPSVGFWSAHNEWSWHYSPDEMMAHFYPAVEEILREDPTRLVEFEGGGDQRGRMSYFSWHYPNRYWDPLIGKPWMKERRHGETYRVSDFTVLSGSKPDSSGEMCWGSGIHLTGYTLYGGDTVYTMPLLGNTSGFLQFARHGIDQLRDLEYANIHPWDLGNYLMDTHFRPVRAVARDKNASFFGGERVVRRYNLHHDVRAPGPVQVAWELHLDGIPVADETLHFDMEPAELRRIEFETVLPQVAERTEGMFRVKVRSNGDEHLVESRLALFPRTEILGPPDTQFGLFDPEGATMELFREAGLAILEVPQPNAQALDALDVLVIGRNAAADGQLASRTLELGEFVKRGGVVLVLEQAQPFQWLPMVLQVDGNRSASIAFPRALDHPVLHGLGPDDLKFWSGDLLSSRFDYVKPSTGNFVVIADGPGQGGLEWAPIVEVLHGRGRYVCSQMLVHDKWRDEPAAARLLSNLLAYAGAPAYRTLGRLGVIAAEAHPLRTFLDYLGLRYLAVPPGLHGVDLAEFKVLLIDGALDPSPTADRLRAYVEQGGTLLVHRIPEETHAAWETLLEVRLETAPAPSPSLMFLDPADPFWSGLAQHDFFWYGHTAYFNPAQNRLATLVERPLRLPPVYGDFPRPADDGPLTMPEALLRFRRGQGQFIVDQLCWSQPGLMEALPEKAPRIVSQMITSLGGSFGLEVTTPREISAYTPVSLGPYANRTFVDEVEDDGQGGWTDQGSNDLRDFPTGRITLEGVPFDIPVEGKTCIILRSSVNRPINRIVSNAVRGIAIGEAADFIYFLHAGAWGSAGSRQFDYVVRYADGSETRIPVVGGDNTGDWWFPDSPLRSARTAWRGKNPVRDPIGLFLFRWTNRFPELPIRELDIVSHAAGQATPMIVGITLAHARETAFRLTRHRPLDLSAAANRRLAADTVVDGTDAWFGVEQDDLRELPVGPVRLAGIPFQVDPVKGCVVLQSAHHPDHPERAEGIAVNGPVARLHFLHGAWITTTVPGGQVGGMTIAEYRIHYADGGSVRFPVVADRHVRHYTDPPEAATAAHVAWTGRNPAQASVTLYAATWDNPHPDRTVAAVDIVSHNLEGTLAVIAITAITESIIPEIHNQLDNPGVENVRPLDQKTREHYERHRAVVFDGPAVFPIDWTFGTHNPDRLPRGLSVVRGARSGERAMRLRTDGRGYFATPATPLPTKPGRIYRLGIHARGSGRVILNAALEPAPGSEGPGFAFLSSGAVGPDWQAFSGRYAQVDYEMSHWQRRQDTWRAQGLTLNLELSGEVVFDDAYVIEEPLYEEFAHPEGFFRYEIVRGQITEAAGKHPLRVTRTLPDPDDLGLWCEAGDRVVLPLRMPAGRYRIQLPVTRNHGRSFRGQAGTGNLPGMPIELHLNDQPVMMEPVGPLRLLQPHEGHATYGQEMQSRDQLHLEPGDQLTILSTGWGGIGPIRLFRDASTVDP